MTFAGNFPCFTIPSFSANALSLPPNLKKQLKTCMVYILFSVAPQCKHCHDNTNRMRKAALLAVKRYRVCTCIIIVAEGIFWLQFKPMLSVYVYGVCLCVCGGRACQQGEGLVPLSSLDSSLQMQVDSKKACGNFVLHETVGMLRER